MSGGFGTRPDGLDVAAGRLDEAARIAAEAAAALRATLGGLGDPPGNVLGDDEQGRALAAQYDPKAAEGLAALDREAAGLGSLGEGLRATARDYRDAESDADPSR